MRLAKALFLSAVVSAVAVASVHDASACGGCFHEMETTQVVGHRMILSMSPTESTLWDQIEYSGDPQSFAWVLPIKGQVNVGISADGLFQLLQLLTQVTVENPPTFCGNGTGGFDDCGGCGGGSATTTGSGVIIIDQQVVGPYETVQLAAADPNALTDWLTQHGYNIPANIQPIIDAYVNEGFGFLALKLVPGLGVNSMKPVRVTTPGATPVLPLRMVSAGTGPFTAIQLWVFGEGRYEPKNFPSFLIDEQDIIWNWDTSSSNYSQLVDAAYTASNNTAWLIDSAGKESPVVISNVLTDEAIDQWADENGMNAQANLTSDLQALYGGLDMNNMWITHMVSKLSQAALANDLQVQASMDQSPIYGYLIAGQETGTSPCPPTGGSGPGGGNNGGGGSGGGLGGGGNGNGGGGNGGGGNGNTPGGNGSCQCGTVGGSGAGEMGTLAFGLAAGIAMVRRRRRARG